jgi:hypothetical protein
VSRVLRDNGIFVKTGFPPVVAGPGGLVHAGVIAAATVLEAVVGTAIPDHVPANCVACELVHADSVDINLGSVSTEAGKD